MKITGESVRINKPTEAGLGRAAAENHRRKVLVPMENDHDCSKKALEYAIPFAKLFNARIVLLTILPTRCRQTFTYDSMALQWVPGETERRKVVQELSYLAGATVPPGIPVEIRVEYGHPAPLIVSVARRLEVELIIISTHCYKGLMYLLMGSVASRVARLSPCPVLVVREKEHELLPADRELEAGRSLLNLESAPKPSESGNAYRFCCF